MKVSHYSDFKKKHFDIDYINSIGFYRWILKSVKLCDYIITYEYISEEDEDKINPGDTISMLFYNDMKEIITSYCSPLETESLCNIIGEQLDISNSIKNKIIDKIH